MRSEPSRGSGARNRNLFAKKISRIFFLLKYRKNFIVYEDFNHERESLLGVNKEMAVFKEMLYILQ